MLITNIHQAKTQLSKLLEQAAMGKDVIIAKAGKPIARLVPFADSKKRKPGFWKGKVKIVGDFDKEDRKINNLFYGQP